MATKNDPIKYILNGQEYQTRDITLELICEDIASRKDTKARDFIRKNKDLNFGKLKAQYLATYGQKAKTKKDTALELLNW